MRVAWHPWTSLGRRQKQEVAGVWPRAPATRSASFWREEDDDWQSQSTWAEPGKAQVNFPLSLSLSLSLSLFYLFLFFI